MTSVPPLPPYWPRKLKRPRLRSLQSQIHLRKPPLPMSMVHREKRQFSLNQVRHTSRRLHRRRPGHPRVHHPAHSLLHLNRRSLLRPQVHITPTTRTTTLPIHMCPTTPLLPRRMATRIPTLILNPPQCTQSIRRTTIPRCSPIHRLFTLPILLRNHLLRSATLTIFQVTRR